MAHKVFVIEDNQSMQDLIKQMLPEKEFAVKQFLSAEDAVAALEKAVPDLIILDLTLPGMDGIEFCSHVKNSKKHAAVPIIIVSARDSESDIIGGLKAYADDYLTKPFNPNIFLARIEAVLRRTTLQRKQVEDTIHVGNLKLLMSNREAFIDARNLHLTRSEFDLLALLLEKPGKVVSRELILNAIRTAESDTRPRAVDVIVVGLRRKLGKKGDAIRTVRGVGYKFAVND